MCVFLFIYQTSEGFGTYSSDSQHVLYYQLTKFDGFSWFQLMEFNFGDQIRQCCNEFVMFIHIESCD